MFWYGEIRALRCLHRPRRAYRDRASPAVRDEWARDKSAVREPAWNCASAYRAAAPAAALDRGLDASAATAQPYLAEEELSDALPADRLDSNAAAFAKAWTAPVRTFPPRVAPMHGPKTGVKGTGVTEPVVTEPGVTEPGVTEPGAKARGVPEPGAKAQGVKETGVETDAQALPQQTLLASRAVAAGAVPKESGPDAAPPVQGVRLSCRCGAADAMARWGRRMPAEAARAPLVCRELVLPQRPERTRSPTAPPPAFPPPARRGRSSVQSPGVPARALPQLEIVLPPAPVPPPLWPPRWPPNR